MFVMALAVLTLAVYPRRAWSSDGRIVSDWGPKWRMCDDRTDGFEIKYPRQFIILPEKGERRADSVSY